MMNSDFDPRMGWPLSALRIANEHPSWPVFTRLPRAPEDPEARAKARAYDAAFVHMRKNAPTNTSWIIESCLHSKDDWKHETGIEAAFDKAIEKFKEWLRGRVYSDTIKEIRGELAQADESITISGPFAKYRLRANLPEQGISETDAAHIAKAFGKIAKTLDNSCKKLDDAEQVAQWNCDEPPASGEYRCVIFPKVLSQGHVTWRMAGAVSGSRFWHAPAGGTGWWGSVSGEKAQISASDQIWWYGVPRKTVRVEPGAQWNCGEPPEHAIYPCVVLTKGLKPNDGNVLSKITDADMNRVRRWCKSNNWSASWDKTEGESLKSAQYPSTDQIWWYGIPAPKACWNKCTPSQPGEYITLRTDSKFPYEDVCELYPNGLLHYISRLWSGTAWSACWYNENSKVQHAPINPALKTEAMHSLDPNSDNPKHTIWWWGVPV